MWHTEVRRGDYIVLRHEYRDCPIMPAKLMDLTGEGAGYQAVYAVVRVETPATPTAESQPSLQHLGLQQLTGLPRPGVVRK